MSQLKSFSPSWKISQGLFLSSIFYSVVLFPLLSPVPPPYEVLLIRFRIFRKVCIKKKHKAPDSTGGLEPWPVTHSFPWHLGHALPKQRSFIRALYWMCGGRENRQQRYRGRTVRVAAPRVVMLVLFPYVASLQAHWDIFQVITGDTGFCVLW